MAVRLRRVDKPNGLLTDIPCLQVRWSPIHSYALLSVVTILCFVPFSARAFHVDDTLFIRAAQNIAKHPFDPYGFQIAWDWVLR